MAANLQKDHVPVSGICEYCGKFWGSTIHCLFFCVKIKHVWKCSMYWEILKKHKYGDMKEVSREMRAKKSREEFEIWIFTLWKIWKFLCEEKHEPDKNHDRVCIDMGKELLENYHEACNALKQRWLFGVQVGTKIWKPPIQGVFRIDVEACFDEAAGLFGVGIAIRNNLKDLCATVDAPIRNPGNVLEAELIGLLYGAGLCLQEEFGPVVMYSDSLNAVRTIAKMRNGEDEIQARFDNFIELCREGFIIDVCHMYREANYVAHALARFGVLSCVGLLISRTGFGML